MKKLFLTSKFCDVADKLSALISETQKGKVAFITTASDVYEDAPWMIADREKLVEMGFEIQDYDIKGKTAESLYQDLKNKDIIFVCGGNCFYLLYHIRKSGFDTAIIRLLDEGKVYIGSSAGAMIMGPNIEPAKTLDNSEAAKELNSYKGLSLIDVVILPHYGREKYEERYKKIINEWSDKVKLLPLPDDQVVLVQDGIQKVI